MSCRGCPEPRPWWDLSLLLLFPLPLTPPQQHDTSLLTLKRPPALLLNEQRMFSHYVRDQGPPASDQTHPVLKATMEAETTSSLHPQESGVMLGGSEGEVPALPLSPQHPPVYLLPPSRACALPPPDPILCYNHLDHFLVYLPSSCPLCLTQE